MSAKKLIFLMAALVAVLLLLIPVANSLTSSLSAISVKENPQLLRRVELVRNNRMEHLFFRVRLNGRTVHRTGNFRRQTSRPMDYREQIIWHPNGDSFFLEVAGKRLWGYHVLEKRDLLPADFAAIPLARFEDTGYTGSVPGEGPREAVAPLPPGLPSVPSTNAAIRVTGTNDVRKYFDFPPEKDQ